MPCVIFKILVIMENGMGAKGKNCHYWVVACSIFMWLYAQLNAREHERGLKSFTMIPWPG
jgi:hypothetical protein